MWTDFQNSFTRWFAKKILYVYITKISNSPAICCYTTLWKSKIQKMLLTLTAHYQMVDMFLKTLWGLDLTLTVVRQTVSRLLTLTDWLTFWSLSDDVLNQQLNLIQLNIVASWRSIFYHDYLRTTFIFFSRLYFVFCTHI